jgi:hypothetical protein
VEIGHGFTIEMMKICQPKGNAKIVVLFKKDSTEIAKKTLNKMINYPRKMIDMLVIFEEGNKKFIGGTCRAGDVKRYGLIAASRMKNIYE